MVPRSTGDGAGADGKRSGRLAPGPRIRSLVVAREDENVAERPPMPQPPEGWEVIDADGKGTGRDAYGNPVPPTKP
jgi:hypothetical protein